MTEASGKRKNFIKRNFLVLYLLGEKVSSKMSLGKSFQARSKASCVQKEISFPSCIKNVSRERKGTAWQRRFSSCFFSLRCSQRDARRTASSLWRGLIS